MKQRWVSIGVLAGALFAVNAVARLITRFAFEADDTAQNRASIAMFSVLGLILAVLAFRRCQRTPPTVWVADLGASALIGMLLTILVGPFISGQEPFGGGAGYFFSQVWLYAGFTIVGTLLGYWVATMLGRDYRSKGLAAYAEAKAHRVARKTVVKRR